MTLSSSAFLTAASADWRRIFLSNEDSEGNFMANVQRKALQVLLSLAAFSADAQPDRSHLGALPVEKLKVAYLECEHLAATTLLDFESAAHCSMVTEELLARGFDGNFSQMLKWWQSARNDCPEDSGCGGNRDRQ
jgi:hypothetical protein